MVRSSRLRSPSSVRGGKNSNEIAGRPSARQASWMSGINFMRARSVEALPGRRKCAPQCSRRSTLREGPLFIPSMSLLRIALPLLIVTAPLNAQKPEPMYETRAEHDRNGTGKFFMGREIAQVMGHQGADWLERPEREEEEKPDKMIDLLGLQPGEMVADIGAGTGYISWRMAQKVRPGGKVYGVDIQQEM